METAWLAVAEFCQVTGLSRERVDEMIKEGALKSMARDGKLLIDASSGANAVIAKVESSLTSQRSAQSMTVDSSFVEKTIGTILSLHEKVLEAKDESISALKGENQFLKDALISMQDIYEDERKTIELLQEQLRVAQEERELLQRKYKLMWGRVVDFGQPKA